MSKNILPLIVLAAVLLPGLVLASTSNGTIDSTYKYAWSDNAGWINFGCDNCDIHITSSALTGFAWSQNYGWINLNPSNCSGETNCGVKNDGAGTLSGSAWGENTGWIDFSGVSIDSKGQFAGAATGTVIGSIVFSCADGQGDNCKILTDWRALAGENGGNSEEVLSTPAPATGGGGGAYAPVAAPSLSIKINRGEGKTGSIIVNLLLNGGDYDRKVEISNFPDFRNASKQEYQAKKMWVLSNGDGLKTIYARFYNADGQVSQTVSDSITLDTVKPQIKITKVKSKYLVSEDVIVGGTTSKPSCQIMLSWDDKYGLTQSDEKGNWLINLGHLKENNYSLSMYAKDALGNTGKTITLQMAVGQEAKTAFSPLISTLKKIADGAKKVIPPVAVNKVNVFSKVVPVPKEAPTVFAGKWNFIVVPTPTVKK